MRIELRDVSLKDPGPTTEFIEGDVWVDGALSGNASMFTHDLADCGAGGDGSWLDDEAVVDEVEHLLLLAWTQADLRNGGPIEGRFESTI